MHNKLNLRDCGEYLTAAGKKLKHGMLYRSGSLDHLHGKYFRVVASLKLKTIIDLRPSKERHGKITFLPGCNRVTIPYDIESITRKRIIPFFNKRHGTPGLIQAVESVYYDAVTPQSNPIRMIFEYLIVERNYPLCINCLAGKDRTGLTIALLLRLLDVPFETVMKDYLSTNSNLLPRVRRVTTPLKLLSFGLLPTRTWEAALTAYDSYLATAFNRIENVYDGVTYYLSLCCVSNAKQQQFAAIILD